MEDISEVVESGKILSGEFFFNIVLHVTILFTILSLFFIFFIRKVSSNVINEEITHIVDSAFKSPSIKNDYKKLKESYHTALEALNTNNTLIDTSNSLFDPLTNALGLNNKTNNSQPANNNILNIINTTHAANTSNMSNIQNIMKKIPDNFNLSYYKSVFAKEDANRKKVNDQVIKSIIHTNIFIVLILLFVTFVLIKNKNLTVKQISHVALENGITFFFVGIVEVIFFLKIALKFIPAPPSTISSSLIENLQKNLSE
jgi:hypothetical protein